MNKELTMADIVDKIQERMEMYESKGEIETPRLKELAGLMGWILCDDEY